MSKVSLRCSECDAEFERELSYYNRDLKRKTKNFFCTERCAINFKKKNSTSKHVLCTNCGVEFTRFNSELNKNNTYFCSNKCFKDYRLQSYKTKICLYCNKEFRVQNLHKDSAKFCSKSCQYAYIKQEKNVFVECATCSKQFVKAKRAIAATKNGKHFCCKECYGAFIHKVSQEKVKPKHVVKKKTYSRIVTCANCGKDFLKNNSQIRKTKYNHFCCVGCSQAFLKKENHPCYKSDRSVLKNPVNMVVRVSLEMNVWKRMVLKRDMYTCQMCGKKKSRKVGHEVKIECHHIKKFIDFPELRFDIHNGICLCKSCHLKVRGKEHLYEDIFLKIVNKKKKIINSFDSSKGWVLKPTEGTCEKTNRYAN